MQTREVLKLKSKLKCTAWTQKCTAWTQCTSIPDGQTDKHHGNSATIRSNECVAH